MVSRRSKGGEATGDDWSETRKTQVSGIAPGSRVALNWRRAGCAYKIVAAVYRELKVAARSEGRSLNGYIVALLKAIVDEANRRKLMRGGRKEFRDFLGTLPIREDSTPLIREDRDGSH